MADEQKQPWYKSIPGILTAATGLIAALSGLVAGLNQLGAFRRPEPPPQVVGVAAPADNTDQDSLDVRDSAPTVSAAQPPVARPPAPSAAQPRAPTPAGPAPAPIATDTAAATATRVPKGALLELAVRARSCAPATGQKRLTARLAVPVRIKGIIVVPAGTTGILRLGRAGPPATPQVRLDSLVRPDRALAVPPSEVQIRRGSVSGVCLRPGALLTVALGAPMTVPR